MDRYFIERQLERGDATGGEFLDVDGSVIGATLEDAFHDPKIYGQTRIPAGTYELGFHASPRFDATYSKRIAQAGISYRGMIQIFDVPNFQYVLLHCGNKVEDTDGCILIGRRTIDTSSGLVIPAGETWPEFLKIYSLIADSIEADGAEIEISDPEQ